MISFKMRGVEQLNTFLKSLPHGSMVEAIKAMGEYFVGNEQHGLRHYPPRVNHGPVNPYKWQSDKQRRSYFASKGFGKGIPSQRSGDLANGWTLSSESDPYRRTLFNRVPYARYVMGQRQQTGHLVDKWRKMGKVIEDNIKGGMRAANLAVDKWLKARQKQ